MKVRGFVCVSLLGLGCTNAALADAGPPKDSAQSEHRISLLAGYGAGERFEWPSAHTVLFGCGLML